VLSFSSVILLIVLTNIILNYVNAAIVICTLLMMSLLSQVVFFIIKKIVLKKSGRNLSRFKNKTVSVLAISASLIYLAFGWYEAHHVSVTEYTVTSEKEAEPMKVVLIADLHVNATFNGEKFKKHTELISSLNPDVILISGDFIDGSSKWEDTLSVIESLGKTGTKYGIYFSYGNHDKNVYNEDSRRDFTSAQFTDALADNGVTILEDEYVILENGYTILGRRDKSEGNIADISELMNKIGTDTYVIDINHQPYDYEKESAAGVDLVLSGHTHGGQMFPIRKLGELISTNDRTYGYERREKTDFIVTSGISDWAAHFKTGCKSEVVLINIVPNN